MQQRGIAASKGLVEAVEIPDCGHAPSLMAEHARSRLRKFGWELKILQLLLKIPVGSRILNADS